MHKKSLLLAAVTVAVIGLQGCSPKEDDAKVKAAIEARNKEVSAAFAKGDAAGVAALYSSGAQMFPPNAGIVSGHDAIQKAWKDFVDAGFKGLELMTVEVEGHGDSADEEGQYRLIAADGKVVDTGKYIVVWKRENGNWFLHRDIWNSSNPPPPPPPPPPAAAAPDATGAVPPPPEQPAVPAPPPKP